MFQNISQLLDFDTLNHIAQNALNESTTTLAKVSFLTIIRIVYCIINGYVPTSLINDYVPTSLINGYVPTSLINGYVPTSLINGYVPTSLINGYVPTSLINGYVPTSLINGYVPSSEACTTLAKFCLSG